MVNIAYLQCELYADCADAVRDTLGSESYSETFTKVCLSFYFLTSAKVPFAVIVIALPLPFSASARYQLFAVRSLSVFLYRYYYPTIPIVFFIILIKRLNFYDGKSLFSVYHIDRPDNYVYSKCSVLFLIYKKYGAFAPYFLEKARLRIKKAEKVD